MSCLQTLKKHLICVVKDKYFLDIWKDCEVRVTYTLFHNIFQVSEEENSPNKNIYHTLALISKKCEESIEDNFINKAKRYIKKNFMI